MAEQSEFILRMGLAGSQVVTKTQPSFSKGNNLLRNSLIDKNILVIQNDHLEFKKDYLFSSSSQAACIILGRPVSGPQSWFNKDGVSLKELEERALKNTN